VVDELGSRGEIEYIRTICERGTSADRQLEVFRCAITDGADPREALYRVIDHVIEETAEGWRRAS
jgi:carboxylate-amine ligase